MFVAVVYYHCCAVVSSPLSVGMQQWADTGAAGPTTTDWGAETVPGVHAASSSTMGLMAGTAQPSQGAPAAPPPTGLTDQDWNIGAMTTTKDWAADEGDLGSSEPVSLFHCGCGPNSAWGGHMIDPITIYPL